MSDRDEFGAFLVGFVVGGLTGAVVALLFVLLTFTPPLVVLTPSVTAVTSTASWRPPTSSLGRIEAVCRAPTLSRAASARSRRSEESQT